MVALFFTVHIIVGFIITPNIQNKMLSIPPALLIFFQVLMGTSMGGLGVILAVPILVILITVVNNLYLDRNMGIGNAD